MERWISDGEKRGRRGEERERGVAVWEGRGGSRFEFRARFFPHFLISPACGLGVAASARVRRGRRREN